MGCWGVRSYDFDEADEALDRAFEAVHAAAYEALMDDGSPLTLEQVQQQLAGPETLAAALAHLEAAFGADRGAWDEVARLALAGVVVRHAELQVAVPSALRDQAIAALEREDLDWEADAPAREARRQAELALLRAAPAGSP
jgi:hypothetical protein